MKSVARAREALGLNGQPTPEPQDVHPENAPTPEERDRYGPVAMLLAPTPAIYTALMGGESVPIEQLNAEWFQRYGRRPGVPASDRVALLDMNTVARSTADSTLVPFAMPMDDFLSVQMEHPEPQLGTRDDTLIPAGGLVIVAGMPGVGKTTMAVDLGYHMAAGREWLGIPIQQPLNVLLIENEGPQHKFQQKLQRKKDSWDGDDPTGTLHVHTWRWGGFSFEDTETFEQMAYYMEWYNINVVIGDPLDTLGTRGVGSPQDTREFVKLLVPLGLTGTRTFIFLHHFKKEDTAEELNQVAGAWGGRLDSLLVVKAASNDNQLRLSFPKMRWGEDRRPLILEKVKARAGYDIVGEEQARVEIPDSAVEQMLLLVVEKLQMSGGMLEKPVLALKCGTDPKNGTFQRAIKRGLERELLASEKSGRKMTYSLTEKSWSD